MDRREFLKSMAALGGGALFSGLPISPALASDEKFWALPRRIQIARAQTGERIDVVYWADGQVQMDGYAQVCALMRDLRENKMTAMDIRLLDLMRAVQAYVQYYGYKAPIMVNSGFRTQKTNAKLEGAAKNSMHLRGKAIDFTLPGLPSDFMGKLAAHYRGGGVGFYPDSKFTHMDTGNVRYWGKKSPY